MQAMGEWYATHPHLFHKRPYDCAGCDTYAIASNNNAAGRQLNRRAEIVLSDADGNIQPS